jgi:hypothetical protein
LECGVACFSFGSETLAVRYVTLSASYLLDNELEGKEAGKSLLTTVHNITKRDQVNIVNIKKLSFSLKGKVLLNK